MPHLKLACSGSLLKHEDLEILLKVSASFMVALWEAKRIRVAEGSLDHAKQVNCLRLCENGDLASVWRDSTTPVYLAELEWDLNPAQDDTWRSLCTFARKKDMLGELRLDGEQPQEPASVRAQPVGYKKPCFVKTKPDRMSANEWRDIHDCDPHSPPPLPNKDHIKIHPKLRKLMDEAPEPKPRDLDAEWRHWLRFGAQELEERRVKEMLARRNAAAAKEPVYAVTKADADMIKDRRKLEGELHLGLDLIRSGVESLEERIENAKELGLREELIDKVERIIKAIRGDDRGRHAKGG